MSEVQTTRERVRSNASDDRLVASATLANTTSVDPDDRVQLIKLGRHLGLSPDELKQLLELYDTGCASNRTFSDFVRLLSRYGKFVHWRQGVDRTADSQAAVQRNEIDGYLYMFA